VRTIVPGFTGIELVRLENDALSSPGAVGTRLEFNVERADSLGEPRGSQVLIDATASPALQIRAGEPLRMRVNGDTLSLPMLALPVERTVVAGHIIERARYRITDEQLQTLAAADSASIRVRGAAFSVRGLFRAENFTALRTLLTRSEAAAAAARAAAPPPSSDQPETGPHP
jgi:hypothetical protein